MPDENKKPHFEFKTIEQIDAEFKAPWSEEEKRDRLERQWRNGYYHGWQEAIDRFWDMMFKEHLSREDAYNALWDHWQGELIHWMHDKAQYLPPKCPTPKKD